MVLIKSDEIMARQALVIRNPDAMQQIALDALETIKDGTVTVVEASTPFTYQLEMSTTSAATALITAESLARRIYPKMAQTEQELYLHMADADFAGRFSTPSMTVMGFVLPVESVLGAAVSLNDGTGARAIVIPKDTVVRIDGTVFTIQYPIVIKVLYNGTFSIYLDTSKQVPTYIPPTNILNWTKSQTQTNDFLVIDLPVQQVAITSQILQLTSFTGFSKQLTFEDYFYYARAYVKNKVTGEWVEIHTTHNSQVYDPNQATVCLNVLNRNLGVYIPQIYFVNGLINDALRIDIYTTKGPLSLDYSGASISDFAISIRDLDHTDLDRFSAPLKSFSAFGAFPRAPVTGGSGPKTFAEIQRRVVNRSTVTAGLPVTTNQLGSGLNDAGFDMVTKLDNITNRQYTAVRGVTPPDDNTTVTGLGSSIQLIEFTLDELTATNSVLDNTTRVTIPPQTLFESINGYLKIVPASEVNALKELATTAPDSIANIVNTRQFYYTPYHYVLDTANNKFNVRPYHLTNPTVSSRYIQQQNNGLGLNIRSNSYSIGVNDSGNGYSLFLELESNASIRAFTPERVTVQLSFNAVDSDRRGWVEGFLVTPIDPATGAPVDNQWIYQFDLNSNFDINSDHHIRLTDSGYTIALEHEFDIVVILKNHQPVGSGIGDIDTIVNPDYITDYDYLSTYIGATQEKLTIRFGYYLKHLWHRSRTIKQATEYLTYIDDVPATYTSNQYERDAAGNIIINYNYETSEIQYNLLHSKGDPIIIDGEQQYLHRKGDVVIDEFGDPIPKTTQRKLARQVDIFLIDGRYYFANNEQTVNYLNKALAEITGWIVNDIAHLQQRLIERTDLFYYPKTSIGLIDVVVGDGKVQRIDSARSIDVTYVLPRDKKDNSEITGKLIDNTSQLLFNAIETLIRVSGGIITSNDLSSTVKKLAGTDVVDVYIDGYFPEGYKTMLTTDVSALPAIGKKLVTMSNLTLQVQDDVSVLFEGIGVDRSNSFLERKET